MTDGFRARPRREPEADRSVRLLEEVDRLRARFARAARDGREAFLVEGSDSYDVGSLAVIQLADFVVRQIPDPIAATLPDDVLEGLRTTRNLAAHNYAALDAGRLWITVTESAPALLDRLESALRD